MKQIVIGYRRHNQQLVPNVLSQVPTPKLRGEVQYTHHGKINGPANRNGANEYSVGVTENKLSGRFAL